MSQTFVKSYTHLKDRPHADRALPMLQRVASLVKPIMRKHNWVLPVLSEFFPDNPSLVGLNVNGGQKILLRLRPPHSPDSFYDEENVVLVMLHELTHNVHGPHDEKFYRFLNELEDEYEALKRSGYAGEGFHTKGRRVGELISHNVPSHVARARALEAAEKRKQRAGVLGGARRLGGAVVSRRLSVRELAAQAAERRARDEKTCGSGAVAQREVEKAARESIQDEVIDLTADSDSEDEVTIVDETLPSGDVSKVAFTQRSKGHHKTSSPGIPRPVSSSPSRSRTPGYQSKRPVSKIRTGTLPRQKTPPPSPMVSTSVGRQDPWDSRIPWTCPSCTLINDPITLQCAACMLVRPLKSSASAEGWTCTKCGEGGLPHMFWSCRSCGSVKTESVLG